MNVKESFSSYTGLIDVGHLAFFINVGKDGSYTKPEILVQQARHFPSVVLFGEVFENEKDLSTFIRKLIKFNSEIKIFIYCNSKKRPTSLGKYSNITYNVNVPMKKSGLSFDERINHKAIKFFVETDGRFIFRIENDNDVDEALTIMRMVGLPKMMIYFSPTNGDILKSVMGLALKNRVNFAPNFKKFLWNDFGRIKKDDDEI